jgi:hypothetical protein
MSVDFTVPEAAPEVLLSTRRFRLIPLTLLQKRNLINFDLRGENGQCISMLTADQNGAVCLATLTAAAEDALERIGELSSEERTSQCTAMRPLLERIAARRAKESTEAINELHDKEDHRLLDNLAFEFWLQRLGSGFLVLVCVDPEDVGCRRILKFSYEEPLDIRALRPPESAAADRGSRGGGFKNVTARLAATIGLMPTRFTFETPGIANALSYHFEVGAPTGVTITRAELVVGSKVESKIAWAAGGEPRAHLHQAAVPSGSWAGVQVSLRASRRGWLAGACASASLIAVTLVVGYNLIARGDGQNSGGGIAAPFLLTLPAVLATLLVRQGEHAMASRLLGGVRVLLAIAGLLTYAGAASLVVGPHGPDLVRLWLYLAKGALLIVTMILMSYMFPCVRRRLPRSLRRSSKLPHVTVTVME